MLQFINPPYTTIVQSKRPYMLIAHSLQIRSAQGGSSRARVHVSSHLIAPLATQMLAPVYELFCEICVETVPVAALRGSALYTLTQAFR